MRNKKNKSCQENCGLLSRKSGQEEMVGFALIIIIVAVIFLVLLVSYIKKPQTETIESAEVTGFVQAFLQYTTLCEQNSENITIQKLISKCQEKYTCSNGIYSCELLDKTLKDLTEKSWDVSPESPVKGYSLKILFGEEKILEMTGGVVTSNYKTATQILPGKGEKVITILFNAYS